MGSELTNDIQFAVLGPLEVTRDGRVAELGGPKPRALLVMLLLTPGRLVRIESLMEALWGEETPATAVKTIQKYVSQLRKRLGGVIATRPGGYVLQIAPHQVDARRFEDLVEQARPPVPSEDVFRLLNEALALWRGDPFSDLPRSDFAVAERARLEERRLTAYEELIEAELLLGRHSEVVGRLERLVAEHPLRERLWSQLMLALYGSGRQADALQAFQRLRRILVDELAIEPSPELRVLQRRILDQDETLPPRAQQATDVGREVPATNLPAQVSTFVGRVAELHEIESLLGRARLVTLTGAAGSGKTRLAMEEARASNDYPDGVWFVDLVALTSADEVAGAFAAPFRLGEQPGQSIASVLAQYLAGKRLLLVVDNCEHLIGEVAQFVDGLLREVPSLRVLATSREPLAIPGEVTFEVAPLSVPEPHGDLRRVKDFDSVRLFVERARSVDTRFELNGGNAEAVARICRRLDGIPLALELAAPMLRAFDPERLEALLDDHFDVLAVAPRTAPARHRTLRAAIDWSFDLLSDVERTLFRRLSIFQGGFDLEAAASVCSDPSLTRADILPLLAALVTKSLVNAVRQHDGGTRYGLLETLRDYGRRQLDEAEEGKALHQRHSTYFRDMAEQADRAMRGPDRDAWIARLGIESGNMRTALAWSLESGEIETGLGLAAAYFSYGSVFWFWDMGGTSPREGLRWLQKGLSRAGDVAEGVRAKALVSAGFLAESQGSHEEASGFGHESLALYRAVGDELGAATAILLLGEVAQYQGDYERGTRLLEDSLASFTRLDDTWSVAWVLHRLGMVARLKGDYERAIALHEDSLKRFRAVGDNSRVAYALWALGVVARYQGDYDRASRSCEESLRFFDGRGDKAGIAHVRSTLGDLARLQGDADRAVSFYEQCRAEFEELGDRRCVASSCANLGAIAKGRSHDDEAWALYEDSLMIRKDIGDTVGVAECLDGLARVHGARQRWTTAAELMGAADAWREARGAALADPDRAVHEADLAVLRTAMGGSDFEEAWRRGRAMTLNEAISLALEDAPSAHES